MPRDGRSWRRVAVAVWTIALIVICVRSALGGRTNSVYEIFSDAGRDWLAGRDVYQFSPDEASGPWRYGPLAAALFAPLSLLPDAVGGVIWRLGGAAVLLVGLAWWSRMLLPPETTPTQRTVLFLLVLPLTIGNLNNGQANPLMLGLILCAAAALARQRFASTILAAFCLSGAVMLKGYPVAAALLFIVAAPRRAIAMWFSVAVAMGLLLPFLLQRPEYVAEQYHSWLQHLRSSDRTELPRLVWYRDIRLPLAHLGLTFPSSVYTVLQVSSGVVLAGLCGWWRGGTVPRRLLLATGLAACWMTVFGSATESATYLLLAPSVGWALLEAWRSQGNWPVRLLMLSGYLVLLLNQLASWFPNAKEFHALGLQPVAGLMVLIGHVLAERKRGADEPAGLELQYGHQPRSVLG